MEIDRDLGIRFMPRAPQIDTNSAAQAAPVVNYPSAPETGSNDERIAAVAKHITDCERCGLCERRTQTVPGEGNTSAELVFIGEGPGADEDKQGRPFVGAAGQLLDKMIVAMGLQREQVFICNVVKCRPPGNRTPEETEIVSCMPWLEQQIQIIKPKIICTLGNTPLRALSGNPQAGITRLRGKEFNWNKIPVIPTFHPSYLLRNQEAKKPCWDDLKLVIAKLGRTLPS